MSEQQLNVSLLTQIAEWLEAGAPHHPSGASGFDLKYWQTSTDCGTTCCIAGAALQFNGISARKFGGFYETVDNAAALLGLDRKCAVNLFMAGYKPDDHSNTIDFGTHVDRQSITTEWAARTVRHLIATGKVDWEATRE